MKLKKSKVKSRRKDTYATQIGLKKRERSAMGLGIDRREWKIAWNWSWREVGEKGAQMNREKIKEEDEDEGWKRKNVERG